MVFDSKVSAAKATFEQSAPGFLDYYTKILLPKLQTYFKASTSPSFPSTDKFWTNNNAESANHIMKLLTDWKPQALMNLINKLYDEVRSQFREVKLALIRTGNFEICDPFKHYQMSTEMWCQKSKEQRHRHYQRFMKEVKPRDPRLATSRDGKFTIMTSASKGKKPGQVKRKCNAKTTTIKAKVPKL